MAAAAGRPKRVCCSVTYESGCTVSKEPCALSHGFHTGHCGGSECQSAFRIPEMLPHAESQPGGTVLLLHAFACDEAIEKSL